MEVFFVRETYNIHATRLHKPGRLFAARLRHPKFLRIVSDFFDFYVLCLTLSDFCANFASLQGSFRPPPLLHKWDVFGGWGWRWLGLLIYEAKTSLLICKTYMEINGKKLSEKTHIALFENRNGLPRIMF